MDALLIASEDIRSLVYRKRNPLPWLEAIFTVAEGMTEGFAAQVLEQLLAQRFLAVYDADLAQMLAQKLGRQVTFTHIALTGDTWREGRGVEGLPGFRH